MPSRDPGVLSPRVVGRGPVRVDDEPPEETELARSRSPLHQLERQVGDPLRARKHVIELPSALVDARWIPSRGAIVGLVIIGLIVAVLFGARVWWAESRQPQALAESADTPGVTSGGSPLLASTSPGASPAASASPSASQVVVHLVGQVNKPGVYRLAPGSRVSDAVAAAGGASPDAAIASVNLARLVVDGEQIVVPKPGEVAAPAPGASAQTGAPGMPGAPAGNAGSSGGAASSGGLVALNSADAAALDTLPGVGPVLAERIIEWRTQNGQFTSVDELGEVSGIGEKILERIRPKVTL